MRDDAERFAKAGVVVFGVNGGGAASHERFSQRHGLSMSLLVDRNLDVARQYGAVTGFGPLKLVKRTVVGIDRDGAIIFYQRGMPSTDEILAAFAS